MTAEPELVAPAGAPIRVREWVLPPFILVALAVVEAVYAARPGLHSVPALAFGAVALPAATAVALWVFGYLAYRDITPRSVMRLQMMTVVALIVLGTMLAFGTLAIGVLALIGAGKVLTTVRLRPIRLVRALLPARLWYRTAIIAAVVGFVGLLIQPLAFGLDSAPLIVLAVVGRVVAPIVFGFAFWPRPREAGSRDVAESGTTS